jgi:hypothetical protein
MTTPLTARQLTHPAILRAQEVHNEREEGGALRDLTDAETVFLAAVHIAGMRCVQTIGHAVRQWGDRSEAYWCVVRLARAQEADDLSLALEIFENSVEAADEALEIEMMAAE